MITSKIKNLIKKAKLKMFTKNLIFFGLQSYKFNWTFEDPGHENWEARVIFNKEDLSQLEAGNIYFNNNILEKKDYDYKNLCYVCIHELLHILNKHGLRKGNKKHVIWAVACDHVVETEMKQMSNIFKPWQNRYNIIDELTDNLPNCSAEQAYNWLFKHKSFPNRIKQNPESDQIEVLDQNGNTMFTVNPQQGGADEKGNIDSVSSLQVDQFISEARAIFNDMKKKGSISGHIAEYLNNILKIEIPWDELLEKAIKINTIMKPDNRSWKNLNKFYQPHGITLPGYSMTETNEGIGQLIIYVDTSGSINKKQLKQFSYIIEKSMHYFKTIKLLVHDVQIHQEKDFDKDNILAFYNFISKEGYKGRGGTSHEYVFNKTNKMWEEHPDDISMVIALTDNYSDIHSIYKEYSFIKNNVPLIILITNDGVEHSFDKNFGEIKQIKMEES